MKTCACRAFSKKVPAKSHAQRQSLESLNSLTAGAYANDQSGNKPPISKCGPSCDTISSGVVVRVSVHIFKASSAEISSSMFEPHAPTFHRQTRHPKQYQMPVRRMPSVHTLCSFYTSVQQCRCVPDIAGVRSNGSARIRIGR